MKMSENIGSWPGYSASVHREEASAASQWRNGVKKQSYEAIIGVRK